MHWEQLISARRLGIKSSGDKNSLEERSAFQRDYDRIIFSSPFRRLQNKTQVFPLPGSVFVHNRLTHSLEVASVGRSLGNIIAQKLLASGEVANSSLMGELGAIVSSACLAHDMGNPPFGHSGEEALSAFFSNGPCSRFEQHMNEREWCDLTNFEGNANAFRLLAHQFEGRREGGFALTYSTLASIVKYPFESVLKGGKKYGFFQSEKALYRQIAEELGICKRGDDPVEYCRHPLVYLVEAADDICYQVMDVEDAHKLKILSTGQVRELYMGFYDLQYDHELLRRIERTLEVVTDVNEQAGYLRAGVIGKLVNECAGLFWDNREMMLEGTFEGSLFKELSGQTALAMDRIKKVSVEKIYNDSKVVQIEVAGYKVLGTLLEEFTHAVMYPDHNYSKKLISMMPLQYRGKHLTDYHKLQSVLDYVSGMTDVYALDLYRKLKGISVPEI